MVLIISSMFDENRCLTIKEASEIVGLSIRRIQELCKKHSLGKKIKNKTMLNKREIDKLLNLKCF